MYKGENDMYTAGLISGVCLTVLIYLMVRVVKQFIEEDKRFQEFIKENY